MTDSISVNIVVLWWHLIIEYWWLGFEGGEMGTNCKQTTAVLDQELIPEMLEESMLLAF